MSSPSGDCLATMASTPASIAVSAGPSSAASANATIRIVRSVACNAPRTGRPSDAERSGSPTTSSGWNRAAASMASAAVVTRATTSKPASSSPAATRSTSAGWGSTTRQVGRGELSDMRLSADTTCKASRRARASLSPIQVGSSDQGRQVDAERRPRAEAALRDDRAAALLDDAVGGRQAESVTESDVLGREEGLEDVLERLCLHPLPRVADRELDVRTSGELAGGDPV